MCRESLPAEAACSGLKMNLLSHMPEVCRANWREESCTEKVGKKELHTETGCHRSTQGLPAPQLDTDQCTSAEKTPSTEETIIQHGSREISLAGHTEQEESVPDAWVGSVYITEQVPIRMGAISHGAPEEVPAMEGVAPISIDKAEKRA